MSTLLAFILLSTSESYVCLSFFKIFFLICVFGLYHGLIALPVILAIAGPLPQVWDYQQNYNIWPWFVQVVEVGPEDVDEYALYSRYSVPETKKQSKGRSVSICREAPLEEVEEVKKWWNLPLKHQTVITYCINNMKALLKLVVIFWANIKQELKVTPLPRCLKVT